MRASSAAAPRCRRRGPVVERFELVPGAMTREPETNAGKEDLAPYQAVPKSEAPARHATIAPTPRAATPLNASAKLVRILTMTAFQPSCHSCSCRRADHSPSVTGYSRHIPYFSSAARGLPHQFPALPQLVMSLVRQHPWPGNIRELRNVIERCAILTTKEWIGPEMLPGSMTSPAADPATCAMMTLEKLEELHIRRVLAGTKDMDQAAEVLELMRQPSGGGRKIWNMTPIFL